MKDEKVLVVDDVPEVLSWVQGVVSRMGSKVLAAGNAEEALALLETERPTFLITDSDMPGMTGLALARAARALPAGRKLAILMHALSPEEIPAEAARQAGVDRVVPKTGDAEALSKVIREVLDAMNRIRIVGVEGLTESEAYAFRRVLVGYEDFVELDVNKPTDLTAAMELLEKWGRVCVTWKTNPAAAASFIHTTCETRGRVGARMAMIFPSLHPLMVRSLEQEGAKAVVSAGEAARALALLTR